MRAWFRKWFYYLYHADNCATQMLACADRFIQFGKQITIEFDTETGTATVVPI